MVKITGCSRLISKARITRFVNVSLIVMSPNCSFNNVLKHLPLYFGPNKFFRVLSTLCRLQNTSSNKLKTSQPKSYIYYYFRPKKIVLVMEHVNFNAKLVNMRDREKKLTIINRLDLILVDDLK